VGRNILFAGTVVEPPREKRWSHFPSPLSLLGLLGEVREQAAEIPFFRTLLDVEERRTLVFSAVH
jgi:hypothetical protein